MRTGDRAIGGKGVQQRHFVKGDNLAEKNRRFVQRVFWGEARGLARKQGSPNKSEAGKKSKGKEGPRTPAGGPISAE